MKAWVLLPYPIGTNAIWRTFGGRILLSREARAWTKKAQAIAHGLPWFDGDVEIFYRLHPRKNKDGSASKIRLDVEAGGKLLLDALQGVIYADDAQAVAQGSIVGEAVEGGGISFICLPAAGRMKAFLDALAPPTQSETA